MAMEVRHSWNPEDAKHYTTEQLRKEFLIQDLFPQDEIKLFYSHVKENLLDEDDKVHPIDLDLVARMGDDFYCRVIPESIFEVAKPIRTIGIGIDAMPDEVKHSKFLTGNHLGQLGNIEQLPPFELITNFKEQLKERLDIEKFKAIEVRHQVAAKLLDQGDVQSAWFWLLMDV